MRLCNSRTALPVSRSVGAWIPRVSDGARLRLQPLRSHPGESASRQWVYAPGLRQVVDSSRTSTLVDLGRTVGRGQAAVVGVAAAGDRRQFRSNTPMTRLCGVARGYLPAGLRAA